MTSERISGNVGTVEHDWRGKPAKPLRKSTAPSKRLGASDLKSYGPTPSQVAKKERYENNRPKETKRKARGGNYLWAQTLGVTRDMKYGIRVKVRGISAGDYWLEYSKASNLWYDVTGGDLQTDMYER